MIIKFRLNDKMHLMNNKAVKDKLRASDVRVANDLTRRQVTNITPVRKGNMRTTKMVNFM